MKYYHIMPVTKYLICFALLSTFGLSSSAQLGTLSPYSRFGLGLLNEKTSAVQMGMGGVSSIWVDRVAINRNNPASYALMANSVFQFDASTQFLTLSEGDASDNLRLSTFDNVGMVFKRNPSKGALAIGLKRFSTTGYEALDYQTLANIGDVTYKYKGSGGINKANIGYGYKVYQTIDTVKNEVKHTISLGLNMDYYFGKISRIQQTEFDDQSFTNTKIVEETFTNSVNWTVGLQSNIRLMRKSNKRLDWIFGSTYSLGKDLKSTYENNTYNFQLFGVVESITDTAYSSGVIDGSFKLPSRVSLGTGIKYINKNKNEFYLLLDYTSQNWSSFTSTFPTLLGDQQLQNSDQLSIGLVFSPAKSTSARASIRETVWRLGYRSNTRYLKINGYSLNGYAFSGGLSIPLGNSNSTSQLNLGTEFGSRSTDDLNIVKEDFVNIVLGLSFTPSDGAGWFKKRQFK